MQTWNACLHEHKRNMRFMCLYAYQRHILCTLYACVPMSVACMCVLIHHVHSWYTCMCTFIWKNIWYTQVFVYILNTNCMFICLYARHFMIYMHGRGPHDVFTCFCAYETYIYICTFVCTGKITLVCIYICVHIKDKWCIDMLVYKTYTMYVCMHMGDTYTHVCVHVIRFYVCMHMEKTYDVHVCMHMEALGIHQEVISSHF